MCRSTTSRSHAPYAAKCSSTRQRDSRPSAVRIWVTVCSSPHSTMPVTQCTKRTQPGRVKTAAKGAHNACHHSQTCVASGMTLPPLYLAILSGLCNQQGCLEGSVFTSQNPRNYCL